MSAELRVRARERESGRFTWRDGWIESRGEWKGKRERQTDRDRERERERLCVCVSIHAIESKSQRVTDMKVHEH